MPVKGRAKKDLIRIGVIVLLFCIVILIDPDQAFEWLARRREAQFDEALIAVVVIGAGFALYVWRRWVDLSRQVAEYQRLQKELSKLNREASRLSETDDLLQSCLSADEAYQVVIRHLKAELPGFSGAICTITPAKDFVEVRAEWGAPALAERFFAPQDCWGLRRGHARQLKVGDDSRLVCAHIGPALPTFALCIPMMAQGETIGILYLDSSEISADSTEIFQGLSESQQRMLATLSEHLALAVANLNLRERLRMQSIRDPLTDLFNRRYMEESLDRELRRAVRKETPLSVMMVDIDHFKKFNDAYGHEAGDWLLQELARIFRTQLRAEDIACRYGGEEFTLILPELAQDVAAERAEDLLRAVRASEVQYRGKALPPFSISIGVSTCPRNGVARETLLLAADRALYAAKEQGRDRAIVA